MLKLLKFNAFEFGNYNVVSINVLFQSFVNTLKDIKYSDIFALQTNCMENLQSFFSRCLEKTITLMT